MSHVRTSTSIANPVFLGHLKQLFKVKSKGPKPRNSREKSDNVLIKPELSLRSAVATLVNKRTLIEKQNYLTKI